MQHYTELDDALEADLNGALNSDIKRYMHKRVSAEKERIARNGGDNDQLEAVRKEAEEEAKMRMRALLFARNAPDSDKEERAARKAPLRAAQAIAEEKEVQEFEQRYRERKAEKAAQHMKNTAKAAVLYVPPPTQANEAAVAAAGVDKAALHDAVSTASYAAQAYSTAKRTLESARAARNFALQHKGTIGKVGLAAGVAALGYAAYRNRASLRRKAKKALGMAVTPSPSPVKATRRGPGATQTRRRRRL